MNRKIVYSILVATIMVTGGAIYYDSYLQSHSSSVLSAAVSVNVDANTTPNILYIFIHTQINSSNSLTKFNFDESSYVEGVNLVYAGQSYSNAVNLSQGHFIANSSVPQLEGFIHFNISNEHPNAKEVWNWTIYNFTSADFMQAPYGYYYLTSHIVSDSSKSLIVHLPKILLFVNKNKISLQTEG